MVALMSCSFQVAMNDLTISNEFLPTSVSWSARFTQVGLACDGTIAERARACQDRRGRVDGA